MRRKTHWLGFFWSRGRKIEVRQSRWGGKDVWSYYPQGEEPIRSDKPLTKKEVGTILKDRISEEKRAVTPKYTEGK